MCPPSPSKRAPLDTSQESGWAGALNSTGLSTIPERRVAPPLHLDTQIRCPPHQTLLPCQTRREPRSSGFQLPPSLIHKTSLASLYWVGPRHLKAGQVLTSFLPGTVCAGGSAGVRGNRPSGPEGWSCCGSGIQGLSASVGIRPGSRGGQGPSPPHLPPASVLWT